MDSATCLYWARAEKFEVYALSFLYGQRHQDFEIHAARLTAQALPVAEHRIMSLDLAAIGGSALTDKNLAVPKSGVGKGVPVTYVPARNTIFLSIALAWAEVLGARDIVIGVNALDYSGYPDCRPEFIESFEKTANFATRDGVSGCSFRIHAPLIQMRKSEIIRYGLSLGVDYSITHSCYDPDIHGSPCGLCDACRLRLQGFSEVN